MKIIDLVPDMIRFTWKGQNWNGTEWRAENCLFTEVVTNERKGITTARAFISHTSYYGEKDKHSMMPAYSNTTEYDKFFFTSVNPDDAINALFNWLVKNRFIWANGKVREYVHNQNADYLK